MKTITEPTYPQPWSVEIVRFTAKSGRVRSTYQVSRFISRTQVEYVHEGDSDEPRIYKTRRLADEDVATLNTNGQE